jgi:hypothetical protein
VKNLDSHVWFGNLAALSTNVGMSTGLTATASMNTEQLLVVYLAKEVLVCAVGTPMGQSLTLPFSRHRYTRQSEFNLLAISIHLYARSVTIFVANPVRRQIISTHYYPAE